MVFQVVYLFWNGLFDAKTNSHKNYYYSHVDSMFAET